MKIALFFYNAFTWLISILPTRVFYFFSDILYVLLYKIFGYRTKVVRENLKNSFPEKTKAELLSIEKKFYHHLCDLMVEYMLIPHISEKQIRKRCVFKNPDVINNFYDKGKSVICVTGHYGNWEMLSGYQFFSKHRIVAIYKPLTNLHFDNYFKAMREKFGAEAVSMAEAIRVLLRYNSTKTLTLSLFIADQSPTKGQSHYWTNFLNQDSSVFIGVERIAQKTDFAVVFLKQRKVSRGHYEVEVEVISENPKSMKEFDLTEAHVRVLEKQIREQPEYWLWSHRRWKHKREITTPEN